MTSLPKTFTLREVAEETGIAYNRLERDARAKRIEHIHIGGTRLMTAEHVEKLLEANTVKPVPTPVEESAARARLARMQQRNRRAA